MKTLSLGLAVFAVSYAPAALAQEISSAPPATTSASPALTSTAPAPEEQLAPVRVGAAPTVPLDREATPMQTEESMRVRAERPSPPPRPPPPVIGRNTITWQPLSLIFASWDFEYERTLIRYLSVYLAGSIVFGHNEPYRGPGDLWVYGGAGDLGLRVFPWGRAPSGFFVQSYFGLTSFYDDWSGRVQGLGWRIGLMPGYSLVVARYLMFSFGTGVEYLSFDSGGYVRAVPTFTLRTAIGVVF